MNVLFWSPIDYIRVQCQKTKRPKYIEVFVHECKFMLVQNKREKSKVQFSDRLLIMWKDTRRRLSTLRMPSVLRSENARQYEHA